MSINTAIDFRQTDAVEASMRSALAATALLLCKEVADLNEIGSQEAGSNFK